MNDFKQDVLMKQNCPSQQHSPYKETRGPKGLISCTSVQCAFVDGKSEAEGSMFVSNWLGSTNLVDCVLASCHVSSNSIQWLERRS